MPIHAGSADACRANRRLPGYGAAVRKQPPRSSVLRAQLGDRWLAPAPFLLIGDDLKAISVFVLSFTFIITHAQSVSLTDALKRAMENRPSIRSAKLKLDQAKLTLRSLASYSPTVLGVGASSRGEVGATDGDLYLSQSIDLFGRTSANRQLGLAGVQAAEASYRGAVLDLQSEVLSSYFEALTKSQLANAANELLVIAEGIQKATVRRFEEGKIAEVQVIRAGIELSRAQQSDLLRKAEVSAALKRLSGVVGAPVSELDSSAALALAPLGEVSSRPDIRALAADIKVADAEAVIARKGALPELEIQARRSSWSDQEVSYGGRVQLTWSIFDYGRSRYEAQAAKKKSDAARASLEDVRLIASAALEANSTEIAAADSQVKSLTQLVASAKSLVAKSQKGLAEGVSTLVDVLEATRALREVEQELAEAQLRLNLATVSRYQLSGTVVEVQK